MATLPRTIRAKPLDRVVVARLASAPWWPRGEPDVVRGLLRRIATMRTGAVLGFIEGDDGRMHAVPWSPRFIQVQVVRDG
jgi:hypothetical protein